MLLSIVLPFWNSGAQAECRGIEGAAVPRRWQAGVLGQHARGDAARLSSVNMLASIDMSEHSIIYGMEAL